MICLLRWCLSVTHTLCICGHIRNICTTVNHIFWEHWRSPTIIFLHCRENGKSASRTWQIAAAAAAGSLLEWPAAVLEMCCLGAFNAHGHSVPKALKASFTEQRTVGSHYAGCMSMCEWKQFSTIWKKGLLAWILRMQLRSCCPLVAKYNCEIEVCSVKKA